jgi:hypothetical protein
MSDEQVVLESTEPNFDYKHLFLAAVKAAGGRVVITNEDYVDPPQVQILNFPEGAESVTFEVVTTSDE